MRNLITGYSVTEGGVLFRTDAERQPLLAGTTLTYQLSAERYCIGYKPPDGGIFSCPDDARADIGSQCAGCAEKELMGPCVRCVGAVCNNPARRNACVFADHFVYLALYDADTVKVGVTRAERLQTRLTEQGALAGIAVAAAGGQEARAIEHRIGDAGWRDRVKLLPLLASASVSEEEAARRLADELTVVRMRVPEVRFMDEGKFVWCADGYPAQLAMVPRLLDPAADGLAGVCSGLRGGHLLLDVPGAGGQMETIACQLRSLVGRQILSVDAPIEGPAQGAFVF